jgi:predicted nucleic acid-binding protein
MPIILIDTNLLVYLFNHADTQRQDQVIQVLRQLEVTGSGRLSVQSLAEFASVSTRKLRPPLTPVQSFQQIESFNQALTVLDLTPAIVLEAARGVRDHRLAYYDAQIWAAARLNQIPVIFSEDFDSGSTLEGVRFVNPFAADFVLEHWK